jgi:hypothetical protein
LPEERKMSEQWRLPTKDELNEIYVQLHKKGLGEFIDSTYWSSSEDADNSAWFQYFDSGRKFSGNKNHVMRVRLVRDKPKNMQYKGLVFTLDGKYFEVAEKDEPRWLTWNEVMRIYGAAEKSDLEIMTDDRDAWMSKAKIYLNLLALVEDDIKDDHTSGLVRAALEEGEG